MGVGRNNSASCGHLLSHIATVPGIFILAGLLITCAALCAGLINTQTLCLQLCTVRQLHLATAGTVANCRYYQIAIHSLRLLLFFVSFVFLMMIIFNKEDLDKDIYLVLCDSTHDVHQLNEQPWDPCCITIVIFLNSA